jgi:hypothetical protein
MIDEAFKLAVEEFKKIDLKATLEKSGAIFKTIGSREVVAITYLNREYLIFLPEAEITSSGSDREDRLRRQTLVLHYLLPASPGSGRQGARRGTQAPAEWIDFRDIPEGNNYYSVFEARVYKPFLNTFGEKPDTFLEAAQSLGGKRADLADFSATIPVFPRVPVTLLIYKGDEEFPPACKVLFKPSIKDYLPTEDVTLVCEDLVKELAKQAKKA